MLIGSKWARATSRRECAVRRTGDISSSKSLAPSRAQDDTCGVDNVAPPTAPARLWSLDALRGLCAGIVFLSHWHLWSNFPPSGPAENVIRTIGEFLHNTFTLLTWPTGGQHPAVIAFFVLSGFCIHYPFERRALQGTPAADWPGYFRRRFRRIAPVYWTACILGLLFVLAEVLQPSGSPLLQLHAQGSTEDIVVRVAGLSGVYPREILAGNYTLTTVTVEIFMYVAYPLFHRYAMRGAWSGLGLMFLLLQVLAVALLRFVTPFWIYNSVLMLGIFWYGGALAAHLYLNGKDRVRGWSVLVAWIVFLGLKALPHFTGLNLLKQAVWGLVCTLGTLWAVRLEQRRPALGNQWLLSRLRGVGDVSYSLYAMHTPAIMLATWALLQIGARDYVLQLAATMVAGVVATFATYRGIERVFYRPRPDVPPASKLNASETAAVRSMAS
jgi:peptidoglycan/LPS O-acetylase OafA/YrhL